jgi:hypothetical protein
MRNDYRRMQISDTLIDGQIGPDMSPSVRNLREDLVLNGR